MRVNVFETSELASNFAAEIVAKRIKDNPKLVLGLATGSTPLQLYRELVNCYNDGLDFSELTTFNLDEYVGLEGSHNQSYRYFMDHNLFNLINIKKENTHVLSGVASDLELECREFDNMIDCAGGIDVQILGVGPNGHIGFNEPGHYLNASTHITELSEATISANQRFFGNRDLVPTQAVTMGVGSIFKAKHILVLAFGSNKARVLASLAGDYIDPMIPITLLKLHPNVDLILDQAAAKFLMEIKK